MYSEQENWSEELCIGDSQRCMLSSNLISGTRVNNWNIIQFLTTYSFGQILTIICSSVAWQHLYGKLLKKLCCPGGEINAPMLTAMLLSSWPKIGLVCGIKIANWLCALLTIDTIDEIWMPQIQI